MFSCHTGWNCIWVCAHVRVCVGVLLALWPSRAEAWTKWALPKALSSYHYSKTAVRGQHTARGSLSNTSKWIVVVLPKYLYTFGKKKHILSTFRIICLFSRICLKQINILTSNSKYSLTSNPKNICWGKLIYFTTLLTVLSQRCCI